MNSVAFEGLKPLMAADEALFDEMHDIKEDSAYPIAMHCEMNSVGAFSPPAKYGLRNPEDREPRILKLQELLLPLFTELLDQGFDDKKIIAFHHTPIMTSGLLPDADWHIDLHTAGNYLMAIASDRLPTQTLEGILPASHNLVKVRDEAKAYYSGEGGVVSRIDSDIKVHDAAFVAEKSGLLSVHDADTFSLNLIPQLAVHRSHPVNPDCIASRSILMAELYTRRSD